MHTCCGDDVQAVDGKQFRLDEGHELFHGIGAVLDKMQPPHIHVRKNGGLGHEGCEIAYYEDACL